MSPKSTRDAGKAKKAKNNSRLSTGSSTSGASAPSSSRRGHGHRMVHKKGDARTSRRSGLIDKFRHQDEPIHLANMTVRNLSSRLFKIKGLLSDAYQDAQHCQIALHSVLSDIITCRNLHGQLGIDGIMPILKRCVTALHQQVRARDSKGLPGVFDTLLSLQLVSDTEFEVPEWEEGEVVDIAASPAAAAHQQHHGHQGGGDVREFEDDFEDDEGEEEEEEEGWGEGEDEREQELRHLLRAFSPDHPISPQDIQRMAMARRHTPPSSQRKRPTPPTPPTRSPREQHPVTSRVIGQASRKPSGPGCNSLMSPRNSF